MSQNKLLIKKMGFLKKHLAKRERKLNTKAYKLSKVKQIWTILLKNMKFGNNCKELL